MVNHVLYLRARRMTLSERSESKGPTKQQTKPVISSAAMSWYVYIAQAPTGRYYTGITTDSQRRIQEHNRDEGANLHMTRGIKAPLCHTLIP